MFEWDRCKIISQTQTGRAFIYTCLIRRDRENRKHRQKRRFDPASITRVRQERDMTAYPQSRPDRVAKWLSVMVSDAKERH